MYKKYLLGIIFLGFRMGVTFGASWDLPGVTIVPRSAWGANESLRYSTLSKTERDKISVQQQEAQLELLRESGGEGSESKLWAALQERYMLQVANDFLVSTYPDEQKVDEVHESFNGKFLKRAESIHLNKSKIIIHHTAEDYSSLLTGSISKVWTALQNIYKYHTVTKGRGDIGYNFIIDPFGNIYEGRAGGDGVVGAHASRNNTSTVGISLMGNFNIQEPTDEQLQALILLSTALTKKYGIDPNAKVSYFKKADLPPYMTTVSSYAVAGHKDDGQATACPGTNLYKLLPDIRTRIKNNLLNGVTATLPTASGSASLSLLALSGVYYTSTTTVFLPQMLGTISACKSVDSGTLVKSCLTMKGIPTVTFQSTGLSSGIKNIKLRSTVGQNKSEKLVSFTLLWKNDLNTIGLNLEKAYMKEKNLSPSTTSMSKISAKIYPAELKGYLTGMINVLLYDMSMNYRRWELACDGMCIVSVDKKTTQKKTFTVESSNGFLYVPNGVDSLSVDQVMISSASGGLVRVTSYDRKSYGGIPWNTFHGTLIIKKNPVKNLWSGAIESRFVWINRLSFSDYMKGIGETSDADTLVKQKLVLLLAKMYSLFYSNAANKHPSIPDGANYRAIDNPDMYQKYVGAGRERTSKTSAQALQAIQNYAVLYDGYVPILPYFTCSAGFTRSAKDKRGWTDTPYLQARMDFVPCFDFKGHGVGVSGKGSQYLSEQGRDVKRILEYYYPGVVLTKI